MKGNNSLKIRINGIWNDSVFPCWRNWSGLTLEAILYKDLPSGSDVYFLEKLNISNCKDDNFAVNANEALIAIRPSDDIVGDHPYISWIKILPGFGGPQDFFVFAQELCEVVEDDPTEQ